jgi:putative phosphoesterase
MTKIAVLSDIHGNVEALSATLSDAKEQGAEEFWFLGDLFMPGPGANDLIDLLKSVNTTVWLRGNWDDFLLQSLHGPVAYQKPTHVYSARLSAFVLESLSKDNFEFINNLKIVKEITKDNLLFSLTHNLRTKNDGHELLPMMPQQGFDRLFEHNNADVAIYGHTHQPILKASSDGRLILNPGSVGSPFSLKSKLRRNRQARYLMLSITGSEIQQDFRSVSYDLAKEFERAEDLNLPYIDLYGSLLFDGYGYLHDAAAVEQQNQRFGYVSETQQLMQALKSKFN